MNFLHGLSILAGIFFAFWPPFMNKSGLLGSASTVVFGAMVMLWALPAAIWGGQIASIPKANWVAVVLAGLIAAVGAIAFNSMLSKAKIEDIGALCLTMILTQIGTTAVYQAVIAKSLPLNRGIGLALAIGSAIMLNKR